MKIVIPGGSGQVGTLLARVMHRDGHEVVVLSRRPERAPWRVAAWDARTLGDWVQEIEGADAVINMAGRSVNCRYTPETTVSSSNRACNRPLLWDRPLREPNLRLLSGCSQALRRSTRTAATRPMMK